MKRFLSAFGLAAFCVAIAHSSDEPPEDPGDWEGWSTPNFTGWSVSTGFEIMGVPGPSEGTPPLFEALSTSPAAEPVTQTFDLGLTNTVVPASGELISETARGLDCNWAQCYLFVRNQIRFTPCKGIARGPERTLLDREGSAGDQAFLLLALLRASGFADTTVRYVTMASGGFEIPLGGTTSGYDATSWLGVITNGTVEAVCSAAAHRLGVAALDVTGYVGASLETSVIRVEHFWVRLTLNGETYDLDPSFKPARITQPSGSLLTDMGYSRTNLLAQAGGTTNAYYVQGLSSAALAAELRRLSANLAAKWREAGEDVSAQGLVGGDSVVSQELAGDTNTFHGSVTGTAVDFLAQTDAYKNALRYNLKVEHTGFTNSFWLDEVGARHLWLSYTNSAQSFPKAVLHLDDGVVGTEPVGASQASDTLAVTVCLPLNLSSNRVVYTVSRALTNVYAIPVGFGGVAV